MAKNWRKVSFSRMLCFQHGVSNFWELDTCAVFVKENVAKTASTPIICMIDKTNNIMNGINVMRMFSWFSEGAHKFTAIDDLERSLIQELDKLRVEAQQRESEADKLVKDTMIGLEKWDKKTEELVSQLHEARDKQVGSKHEKAFISWNQLSYLLIQVKGRVGFSMN